MQSILSPLWDVDIDWSLKETKTTTHLLPPKTRHKNQLYLWGIMSRQVKIRLEYPRYVSTLSLNILYVHLYVLCMHYTQKWAQTISFCGVFKTVKWLHDCVYTITYWGITTLLQVWSYHISISPNWPSWGNGKWFSWRDMVSRFDSSMSRFFFRKVEFNST